MPDRTNTQGSHAKKHNKPSTAMAHVPWESKLRLVVNSSMHPRQCNWVAIGRAVVYSVRVVQAYSAGIKCRHCRYLCCFTVFIEAYKVNCAVDYTYGETPRLIVRATRNPEIFKREVISLSNYRWQHSYRRNRLTTILDGVESALFTALNLILMAPIPMRRLYTWWSYH